MLNMTALKRQHEEINGIVDNLKEIIGKGNLNQDAASLANLVSVLAGKLKIHLSTEDSFMYPLLLESENAEIRNMAQAYMTEMGYIRAEFMNYKEKFNTRTKILGNTEEFLIETKRIFEVLEDRINKEESALYSIL